MAWRIKDFEFDSYRRVIYRVRSGRRVESSAATLGQPLAKFLDLLIDKYGVHYNADQFAAWATAKGVTEGPTLYTAATDLRKKFGDKGHAYILKGPYRLAYKPIKLDHETDDPSQAAVHDHQFHNADNTPEDSAVKSMEFTLIGDGMIINSVSELLYEDQVTAGIRSICSASYERSLQDLAFATVYAVRMVTGKDFRPSLTAPTQPGQELAARIGQICEQRPFPVKITNGHLLRDENSRAGIRADMRRFARCMDDNRNRQFFRDYMLREGTKHLGTDDTLFQEDFPAAQYRYDVKREYYKDPDLQNELGSATEALVGFLPPTPLNSSDRYATNALREFATRNVLSLITIMWEGKEFAADTDTRRVPHVLRALVDLEGQRVKGNTQHQELVRDVVVQYALTTALKRRDLRNRDNLMAVLLDMRDDPPFKRIRDLLNRDHLMLLEPGPKNEQLARRALKTIKDEIAANSMPPDTVRLAPGSVIRAVDYNSAEEYRYQLHRVFPELRPTRDLRTPRS
jgi:hypothetical protein